MFGSTSCSGILDDRASSAAIDPGDTARAARSLSPAELAHASVMAALTAATAVIGALIPFVAAVSALGTVPMGLLAFRYRLTVLITSAVSGCTIAFLVSGTGGAATVANCAYIGGVTGIAMRRRLGPAAVVGVGAAAGAVLGGVAVLGLAILTQARLLMFESMNATVDGVAAVLRHVPSGAVLTSVMQQWFTVALRHWPLLLIAGSTAGVAVATITGWWVLSRVLKRLAGVPDVHVLDATADTGPAAPVPVLLRDVRFRYPHTEHDALQPVSLTIDPGEHVAITGANGSGKTTMMLVLAGRAPTGGTVIRPGAVGLGRAGGTAVVLQHPESQVLGARVRDDVVWGLPPGTCADVEGLLAEVGLTGMGDRDTSGLSGGELQRLAVAAALARRPALLIADEVTSMVDPTGREALVKVLADTAFERRMALAHITHYRREADSADRAVRLAGRDGEGVDVGLVSAVPAPVSAPAAGHRSAVFELDAVSHVYGCGTPWAHTALRDVGFTVSDGEGVLIHGDNGSGKSTLAWAMAGLLTPTSGSCLVNGEKATRRIGSVAISFQAARLQLLRERVDVEIASAGGFDVRDRDRVVAALKTVRLEPSFADRRTDRLSGGQQRRVALAALLARSPRAVILDEPLAGLDASTADGLVRLLADLRRTTGVTIVVISHDFSGLDEVCPRTLHLRRGELVSERRGDL